MGTEIRIIFCGKISSHNYVATLTRCAIACTYLSTCKTNITCEVEQLCGGRAPDAGQKQQERSSKAWAEVSKCTGALWVVMVMLSDVY